MAVDEHPDLNGKTYIVVGSTSGIGKTTVERLANCGARVIMASRNREKCQRVRRDIVLSTRNKQVYCRQCDLTDFDSVREFVEKIYRGPLSLDRIDGLVHSAAVMEPVRSVNRLGIETTLATNHLGPFLLSALLVYKLYNQDHSSRIVYLNTRLATKDSTKLNLDNFNSKPTGPKDKWRANVVYKSTKLAQLISALELARRMHGSNVHVLAVDPGWTKTRLDSNAPLQRFFLTRWALNVCGYVLGRKSPYAAAKRVVYALTSEELADANGLFIGPNYKKVLWGRLAFDDLLRQRLWLTSLKWTRYADHLEKLHRTDDRTATKKKPTPFDSKPQEPPMIGQVVRAYLRQWISWL